MSIADAPGIAKPVVLQPYKPKRGEAYMSPNMQAHFKAILQRWRSQLMQEAARMVGHMQGESAAHPDPLDRASQEEEFNFALRTRDRERRLLKKIQKAIESIDSEAYGYCESCGSDIGLRRLEARPTATLCIDCKTIDEIREKQVAG